MQDKIYCYKYHDNLYIHLTLNDDEITGSWSYSRPQSEEDIEDTEDFHQCEKEVMDLNDSQIEELEKTNKYIINEIIPVCEREGHSWGDTTFDYEGEESRACKECNTIKPVA